MMWKSIKEEWPYSNDEVWFRWTTDGVTYKEKIVHEKDIDGIDCIGIPEWRPMDPPEWMTTEQKEKFDSMKCSWAHRVSAIEMEDYDEKNPL